MKKEFIRLAINGLLVMMAAFLTRHYYDIGMVNSNACYRVAVICIVHLAYIGATGFKRLWNSQEEA